MAKKKDEVSTPMDPTAREVSVGQAEQNHQRTCYAAQTLMAEVEDLFPEVPVEVSNYDGRNTGLDVTFDTTVVDMPDRALLVQLLELVDTDARVADLIVEDDIVLVSFKSNPRTQDNRDPFGLGEAYDILDSEADEQDEPFPTLWED